MNALRSTLSLASFAFSLGLLSCTVAHADQIESALSGRHFGVTPAQLESMAGGEDALVKRLIELRTQEEPAFVGLRAEKILLTYASRDDVIVALEEDLQSVKFKGLAQLIAMHLDQIERPETRLRLARGIIERAKTDASYRSFAESLKGSSDPAVNRAARDALGGS